MSERLSVSEIGLVNRYHQEFPSTLPFLTDRSGHVLEGTSSQDFTKSRTKLMDNYINGGSKHREMFQALIAEEFVSLSLGPLLK